MADSPDEPGKTREPTLRLVSSRTSSERERVDRERRTEFAKLDVDDRLKSLAANILRVVRGAGRAYEIPEQIYACALAIQAYRDAAGLGLSDYELSEMLSVREEHHGKGYSAADWDWASGIEQMMRGGLQLAASRLLEQRTQEQAGQSEMFDGARAIERSREERRREFHPNRQKSVGPRTDWVDSAGATPTKPAPKGVSSAKGAPQKTKEDEPEPPAPPSPPKPPKKPTGGRKAVLAMYKADRGIK